MPKLSHDERVAAWRLHRPLPPGESARVTGLPTVCVARILDRRVPAGHRGTWCVLYEKDDTIWSGRARLWRTGARRVMAYLLAHVPEVDLARLDRFEWGLWAGHCRQQGRVNRAQQPRFYRAGREFTPAWLPDELAALEQELDAL